MHFLHFKILFCIWSLGFKYIFGEILFEHSTTSVAINVCKRVCISLATLICISVLY